MQLTKHHGLGNDFLVRLAGPDEADPDSAAVRGLCDRRLGVGADGLIVARVDDPVNPKSTTMRLWNADGGEAEMSGNGIRGLVQAVARDRSVARLELDVETAGGRRHCQLEPGPDALTDVVIVDMGDVAMRSTNPDVVEVDLGNPHRVFRAADAASLLGIDLLALGGDHPDVNVEVIAPGPGPRGLTMIVHERGVGVTEACGTGAVAATAAARHWGLVDGKAEVHMPGGVVDIALSDDGRAELKGPIVFVARVDVAHIRVEGEEADEWH